MATQTDPLNAFDRGANGWAEPRNQTAIRDCFVASNRAPSRRSDLP